MRIIPRRLVSLLLLSMLGAFLTSCTPAQVLPKEEPMKRVALVMKMSENDYWKTVQMGAEAAAKEFGVQLIVKATEKEEDVQGQLAIVNGVLQEGTDALVLAASDYAALAEPANRAAAMRIPVITIDSEVNSTRVKSFIGINNFEAGKQAGEKLIALTGPQAKVGVLLSAKGAKNMEEREKGVRAALAQHPQVQLIAVEDCSVSPELCEKLTVPLLRNQIDGIAALNAVTSEAVARMVAAAQLPAGQVKLVTFDSTPEELERLQDGIIQATIIQNPFSMGYLGVKTAVDAMAGRRVEARVETGTKVIDAESMFWPDNQKLLFPFVK